jgi:hypothetical protein
VVQPSPKKRFTGPVSAAAFTTMGGIPDEDLAVLLNFVVKRYKATAHVQKKILEHPDITTNDWLTA